jgi:light-regulated signal transduction histidine kinase (bacteriophytochrome)
MRGNKHMSHSEIATARTVDLTDYDKELLHLSGAIQPHGMLFVLKEPHLEIIQVSNNTFEFIGLHPQELISKEFKDLLEPKEANFIRQCLLKDFENINPLKISINVRGKILVFDGIIHRSEEVLLLELEPRQSEQSSDFLKFYHLVKGSINKIANAASLQNMCQIIVKEVQKLTGFDRVIIYQFDTEQAGKVIAEEKLESLSPYLGLRYPASDIPDQAKQLYTLNRLRLIPDVNSQPIELVPAHNPLTNKSLDLSYSVLRSVSPCHFEYLKNMGVTASMSISLIRDNKLWGLIACHHQSPKHVTYEVRTACEFLGQVMSLELAAKEDNENIDYKIKLKSIQSKFIETIPQEENLMDGLVKDKSNLLNLVSSDGIAICTNGHLSVIGKTPEEADIQNLIEWVETKINNDIFYTDSLPKIYPAAEKFKDVGSGLIALSISQIQKNYILWFRSEVIQTVNWGANPNEKIEFEQNSVRFSPRKSFELWQETVRCKSLPWKQCEIDAVLDLRNVIVGIVLRKADELARINIELARSNSELDAFAYIASHDLKEPLRGIHNYSSFLIEDYANVLSEEGVSKLQTLVRLTQRMEDLINSLLHFSRLGRVELSMQKTDLNELVNNVIDVLNISLKGTKVKIRIPRPLPFIECDRVQVSEVFSNLISNAIKYNDKVDKWVEIGFLESGHELENKNLQLSEDKTSQDIVFYIRDNGIGIREKHLDTIFRIFKRLHAPNRYGGGTGAGLTIAKKIVERHDGRIWVESKYGEGSTFYFTLPS